MLKEQIAELFLEYRQDLCDTEFAPEPFEQTTDIDLHNRYARKVLALFPQGERGVLCDDSVCKLLCGEEPCLTDQNECLLLPRGRRVAQAQHALDNQSKQAALKEQMERVIGVIEEKMEKLTSQINSYQCPQQVPTAYLAQSYALDALKAELEGEGLVLELGCRYLNSEFECEKGLLINSKCPSECVYYDDGSR